MGNNKYFKAINTIKTVIGNFIFSGKAIQVELSREEFESATDFANKIGFFLLEVGKETHRAEKHESLTFFIEFYNDDIYACTTYDYGVTNNLEIFEQIYERLEEDLREHEKFVLKVKYEVK